jgi:hypothetical protein
MYSAEAVPAIEATKAAAANPANHRFRTDMLNSSLFFGFQLRS